MAADRQCPVSENAEAVRAARNFKLNFTSVIHVYTFHCEVDGGARFRAIPDAAHFISTTINIKVINKKPERIHYFYQL
jgi:hypothetical protein